MYVSGSADLHGSNKNYIKGGGDFGVNLGKRYVVVSRINAQMYPLCSLPR